MHIALFGGSFNPPHIGHVLNACYVLSAFDADELWVMPVFAHPFASKRNLWPFELRMELCREAFACLGSRVVVSDIEEKAPAGSKTVDLLEWLLPQRPGDTFSLVVGSDILKETHLWKRFDRIQELVRLIVVQRAGCEAPSLSGPVIPEVSSTGIRRLLAAGEDPKELLPLGVRQHLKRLREAGKMPPILAS